MPIYEYRCDSCGEEFERLVKMDAESPPCPSCSSVTRKKVSAAGFVLKGSGWYKDHYGLKKSASKADSGASETSGKTGSTAGSDSGGKKSSDSANTASKPKESAAA